MNTESIEKLRIAANKFYLNKYEDQPSIPDSEYDALVAEYKAEGGSVVDLVEWDSDMRRSNTPLPKVEKTQVGDNDLSKATIEYVVKVGLSHKDGRPLNHYVTYKYDGSSVIAYYTPEGKLQKILGTPDQDWCMDRTRNCWNMFPHQINPGIECIQGEFLVDAQYYGELARNKANGLLNSKDMVDELESEGFIRIYQMRFYDGNWSIERLIKELEELPIIARVRERSKENRLDLVFASAERFLADRCPATSIIQEGDGDTECKEWDNFSKPKFQVDGVVVYHSDGYHALKFYYTESAITTVTKVVWTFQDNGGYSCKLWFEPITLNGKSISQVSSGGVPNLMSMKMGKGAKIRVILANMTIPKVIETIEPSEDYEWPTCECGYQMSEKDIFGSVLKCQSDFCSRKYNHWKPWFADIFKDEDQSLRIESFSKNLFYVLEWTLNIDRWKPQNQLKVDKDKFFANLTDVILNKDLDNFKSLIEESFYLTELNRQILNANIGTAFKILQDYLKE